MKILAVGDIYGEIGRDELKKELKELKKIYEIDFIVINGENTAHGKSITEKHYNEFKELKVDVITSGNHIWANNWVVENINHTNDLLRPLNYGKLQPGNGTILITCKNKRIRVTNLIGRAFMEKCENPYEYLKEIVNKNDCDIHLVDFHAEATAEKIALAWDFDGKITALWGTHTHVQTNDARVLPKRTAFITDIGMTGPYDSIIGADPEQVIYKDKTGMPARFKPATGAGQFNGVIFEIDDKTNKVIKMTTIYFSPQKRLLTEFNYDSRVN